MIDQPNETFLAPRRCMREPIPELLEAAHILGSAVDAHLAGQPTRAPTLFRQADTPAIRQWTESLWESAKANPDQWRYRRPRPIADAPSHLPMSERSPDRKPNAAEQAAIIGRYGRHCVFCQVPLIRGEVRAALHRRYPEAVPWGRKNHSQHAGFQALWLQFDHLLPHSRGGDSSVSNVVVTCAGCNYGRMQSTLEELGLVDPRPVPRPAQLWDGLERVLAQ